jgi:hypothetical protein
MGYTPPAEKQTQLRRNLEHYKSLGRVKMSDILVRRNFILKPESKSL